MMRYTLLGLLIAALLIPLTTAQEPDEPPVRLKKKERPDVPKPEPEKKEDPKPEPKPPEPKPDDKSEPEAPPPAESEEEIFDRLLKNTKKAQDRLANREVDDGTQQLQRDILDDIQKLIRKSESDQGGGGQQNQDQQNQDQKNQDGQQGQQSGKPQPGMGGGSKQQGQSGRERRQQARQQRQGQGQQARQPGQPGQGNPGQGNPQEQNTAQAGPSNQGGGGGMSKEEMNKIADLYKDVWGHLPETLRAEMNAYSREKFMAKYKDLIEKYYTNLAEKGRKGP